MSNSWSTRSHCLIIGLSAFLVASVGISIPFHYDDFNRLVFARQVLHNPFEIFNLQVFEPLDRLFFLLNLKLFGVDYHQGYHISASIIHALNAVLLYLIGIQLLKEKRVVILAAYFFATFPFNLGSVWWSSNSENTLSNLLYLITFLFFIYYIKTLRQRFFVLTLLASLLTFLTKPHYITLWLIMTLYGIFYYKDLSPKIYKKGIPLIFIVLILSVIFYFGPKVYIAGTANLNSHQQFIGVYGYVWDPGPHIFSNIFSLSSRLFLFDKFLNPKMPYGIYFSLIMCSLIISTLVFNVIIRPSKNKKVYLLLFLGILPILAGFSSFPFFVKFISFGFMVYWVTFGNNFERFSVSWIFIVMMPIFPFLPHYFIAERYLYFPSIGFVLLISTIIFENINFLIEVLDLKKFKPLLWPSLTAIYCSLTAIFGYDKFMDMKSIGLLEKLTHDFIYSQVPKDGYITIINEPPTLWFKKQQLSNMGREDIKFRHIRINDSKTFYLGDGPFIDYRWTGLRQSEFNPCYSLIGQHKLLPANRLQLQTGTNVKGIIFNCPTITGESGLILKPEDSIQGIVIFDNKSKRNINIECNKVSGVLDGEEIIRIKKNGEDLVLKEVYIDGRGGIHLNTEAEFQMGKNNIEIINTTGENIRLKSIALEQQPRF